MARLMFLARSPDLEAAGAVLIPAAYKPEQSRVPARQGGAPAGPRTSSCMVTESA